MVGNSIHKLMDMLDHRHLVFILVGVIALLGVLLVHAGCNAGHSSLCTLTMCTFILSAAGMLFVFGSTRLLPVTSAAPGVHLFSRVERPPCR